jgi:polyferredoxin
MAASKQQINGQEAVPPTQDPGTQWLSAAEAYGRIEFELVKLKTVQVVTRVVATMAFRVAILAMAFLFVLMLSMGAGLLIGEWVGKPYSGFLIVALVYLVLIVIMTFFMGGWIRRQVRNAIIMELLK